MNESPKTGNLIVVDRDRLQQDVSSFMRSPQADKLISEDETSVLTSIFYCAVFIVMGLVMMITIKWWKAGLAAFLSGLVGAPILERKSLIRKKRDQLVPLICHGVISSDRFGVVLGSFSGANDDTQRQLALMATKLGTLYANGPTDPTEQTMYEMLHQVTYQPYRRRHLVSPFDGHSDFILFDVSFDRGAGVLSPYRTVMNAFVALEDEDADNIMQIPWHVVSNSVRPAQ